MRRQCYLKSLLVFCLVCLLMTPVMSFADTVVKASEDQARITKVYFKDEQGQMVFVDYEKATRLAMEGDKTLYEALKVHVGKAEKKAKPIYVETQSGSVYDYQKAITKNTFSISDVIQSEELKITTPIVYTHELKLINGVPGIVVASQLHIVSINPVTGIRIPNKTTLEEALALLPSNTTVKDNEGKVYPVSLSWHIDGYDGNKAGVYTAIGQFELPDGVDNKFNLVLEVRTTVEVLKAVAEFPVEVSTVDIGKSEITGVTYVNITIKPEYVGTLKGIKVHGVEAFQNPELQSQWRCEVTEGTTVDALKGKVEVVKDVPVKINWTHRKASEFLPVIRHITLTSVEGLSDATFFSVTYVLAGNEVKTTESKGIGTESEGFFFNGIIAKTVKINVYDAAGNLIYEESVSLN